MPLQIVRNDITKMTTDAIVNAANSNLKMGGGVCGAIFRAAGPKQLQKACDRVGHCAVGEAVPTDGFELNAKYIIHTVGPVWEGGGRNEEVLLRNCYRNSLELAIELGCESIAFPLISTGIFGYPKESALRVATEEINEFLNEHDMDVYLVVLDKQSFGLSQKLYESIETFINEQEASVLEEQAVRYQDRREMEIPMSAPIEIVEQQLSLEEFLEEVDESFSQRLFRFIDDSGMTDAETYKKANLDKKLFSKIRNSPGYTPKKKTILAFAIALELDLDETEELLGTAGYRLSNSHKFDLIVHYFIEREQYNIFEINEALFAFDEALLGS
ncbi:macro domain-containing protein [Planococcus alpniumensis]|uniref:macro domain-containing protein n=1 Tax=Planococcus alpniumensis TaxID=2708345 RepID=UPI001B8AF182|nr:macro domain-containing protein [Planococcus sp. MSAK28401]